MEIIMGNSLWINSRKWIDIEWCLLYAKKGCNDRVFRMFIKVSQKVFKKNSLAFKTPDFYQNTSCPLFIPLTVRMRFYEKRPQFI
jgi:hypothetical protein